MRLLRDKIKSLHFWIPVAIVAVTFLIVTYWSMTARRAEKIIVQEKAWPVQVVQLERGTYTPNLLLYGIVGSPRTAKLTAAVTAFVQKIIILPGDPVKANEVIMRLDARDTQNIYSARKADVAHIESQLKQAEVEYVNDLEAIESIKQQVLISQRNVNRQKHLAERHIASKAALDEAENIQHTQRLALTARKLKLTNFTHKISELKARLARAQAELSQATLDLERTEVRAPFDGTLTKLLVSEGDRVTPGMTLAEMFDNHLLEVRAQIPTRYLKTVREALRHGVTLTASGEVGQYHVKLKLLRLGGERAQGSGGVDAFYGVLDQHDNLALGQAVLMRTNLPPLKDVFSVPANALYENDRIFKITAGRLEAVQVNVQGERVQGNSARHFFVTSDTLKTGDQILAIHLPNAITGLKVKVNSTFNGGV